MLQKEGQVRIPAGCAISGIFHKDGTRENGTRIIDSIRTMHDRSNGLGGGFAGYGIYPEYADYYAFHVFYDTQAAKEECEREIERHFDIVNLSKIPTCWKTTRPTPGPAMAVIRPTHRAGGAARIRLHCSTPRSFTTARFPLMMQTAASLRCSATPATC